MLETIKIKSSGLCESLLRDNKINSKQAELISALCRNYNSISQVENALGSFINGEVGKLFGEFSDIVSCVASEKDRITINFSLAAEAGYYSGIVFKGFINGIPSSVLSGGQYDKLMRKLGSTGGAVGFAVYPDSFEGFVKNTDEYDVDTILLVKENDNPQDIMKTVGKIRSTG